MADKTWKAFERRVASFFKTERTPLSGGNGKQTRSDTLHPDLFVECKHRKSPAVVTLWEETAELAKKEGTTPVLALGVPNRKGFWIVVHSADLEKLIQVMKK